MDALIRALIAESDLDGARWRPVESVEGQKFVRRLPRRAHAPIPAPSPTARPPSPTSARALLSLYGASMGYKDSIVPTPPPRLPNRRASAIRPQHRPSLHRRPALPLDPAAIGSTHRRQARGDEGTCPRVVRMPSRSLRNASRSGRRSLAFSDGESKLSASRVGIDKGRSIERSHSGLLSAGWGALERFPVDHGRTSPAGLPSFLFVLMLRAAAALA